MLEVLAVSTLTALATGLGVIPVWALGTDAERWRPSLTGFAGGAMAVAAFVGLLGPALDRGSVGEVAGGFLAGVAFLLVTRLALGTSHNLDRERRSAMLIFGVLFVHSLPEGFAIGTAYASEEAALGAFVVVAIALQNIPEGTGVALPLAASGASVARQAWAAVLTSVPQPIGACIAFLLVESITGLLPISFGFAAGAMLMLVITELRPHVKTLGGWSAGFLVGAGLMLAIGAVAGV